MTANSTTTATTEEQTNEKQTNEDIQNSTDLVPESTTTKILNTISHIPTQIKDATLYIPRYFGYFNEKTDPIQMIHDHLDTLDIILCNGQNYWFSEVVEYASWSEFSHIGIVLKSPTWIHPELTGMYFLESGTERMADAEDHKLKFGVQITDLEQMINDYTGKLYFRKLISVPFREHPEYYYQKIKEIHDIIHNKHYDDNPLDLIKVDLRVKLGDNHRTNDFFCSALVAFIYTQLGFLPADTQWDLFLPKDFDTGYGVEKIMERKGLANLGPMVRIK